MDPEEWIVDDVPDVVACESDDDDDMLSVHTIDDLDELFDEMEEETT